MKTAAKEVGKPKSTTVRVSRKVTKESNLTKFSPSWVVLNGKDTPGYKMELIGRIREGVKKTDWKQLIQYIGSTEKEFEHILPASISSMQKKTVYSKETSERIYELASLFGLGYDVFDSKEDFKKWLTRKKYNIWVQKFASFYGYKYMSGNTNGVQWFLIENEKNTPIDLYDQVFNS